MNSRTLEATCWNEGPNTLATTIITSLPLDGLQLQGTPWQQPVAVQGSPWQQPVVVQGPSNAHSQSDTDGHYESEERISGLFQWNGILECLFLPLQLNIGGDIEVCFFH